MAGPPSSGKHGETGHRRHRNGSDYVNPEGPNASGEPLSAAAAIRATFGNMAMDDEDRRADRRRPCAGQTHGAAETSHVGAEPEAAPLEAQGLGWHSSYGSGAGADAITSGLEVVWTQTPTSGATTFSKTCSNTNGCRPAARLARSSSKPKTRRRLSRIRLTGEKRKPTMLVTDLTLRFDPEFENLRRFLNDPQAFNEAFARAWFADPP